MPFVILIISQITNQLQFLKDLFNILNMFRTKKNLVIAITVSDADALRISVPPLRGFARNAILVIHNDNPDIKLTDSDIKKLGWRGTVHIINTDAPCGELLARVAIIDYCARDLGDADWLVFVNEADILINTDIPDVSKNAFAVVQNATTLTDKVTDIFKIARNWATGTKYGQTGPRFDITGPMLRTMFLGEFAEFIKQLMPQIEKIAHSVRGGVSFGVVMWNALNAFMRAKYPYTAPIYMHSTNYVAVKMGSGNNEMSAKILDKYNDLFESAANENLVAPAQ